MLSGAFRSGLIEARTAIGAVSAAEAGYPGLFAPASLKHFLDRRRRDVGRRVIRGFSLRPH